MKLGSTNTQMARSRLISGFVLGIAVLTGTYSPSNHANAQQGVSIEEMARRDCAHMSPQKFQACVDDKTAVLERIYKVRRKAEQAPGYLKRQAEKLRRLKKEIASYRQRISDELNRARLVIRDIELLAENPEYFKRDIENFLQQELSVQGLRRRLYNEINRHFPSNPEIRVAIQCAKIYGPTKAGIACTADQLAQREWNKCKSAGIGTKKGCFGPNNDIRRIVEANFRAANRERGEVAKIIRATTGISILDIERRGLLGGDNSDARKACRFVAGLFNSKC